MICAIRHRRVQLQQELIQRIEENDPTLTQVRVRMNRKRGPSSSFGPCVSDSDAVFVALRKNRTVEVLHTTYLTPRNYSTERKVTSSLTTLAKTLKENSSINDLTLANIYEGEGSSTLANALSSNSCCIKHLSLFRPFPSGRTSTPPLSIMQALRRAHSIETFDVVQYLLDPDQMSALCKALRCNNASLKSLGFMSCFQPEHLASATVQLARALENNSSVERLTFQQCRIGDVGAVAISEVLRVRGKIKSFSVIADSISGEGAAAIADALEENTKLEELVLRKCEMDISSIGRLTQCLTTLIMMKRLTFFNIEIGDEGALVISKLLHHNRLTRLDVGFCGLSSQGAKSIASALELNTSLKKICVSGEIGEDGVGAFESVLKSCNHTVEDFIMLKGSNFDQDEELIENIKSYAETNKMYTPVEAEARKTQLFPMHCLSTAMDGAVLPQAVSRISRMGSLSVLLSFVQQKNDVMMAYVAKRKVSQVRKTKRRKVSVRGTTVR